MNSVEKVLNHITGRWMQGHARRYNPDTHQTEYCLMGSGAHCNVSDIADLIAPVIREQYPDRLYYAPSGHKCDTNVCVVVHFNDHEDTSWDDVRVVLEKAAIRD